MDSGNKHTAIVKMIHSASYNHNATTVFSDWVHCAALAFRNAVDFVGREKREEEYHRIRSKYRPQEFEIFPKILAEFTMALEEKPYDIMGKVFHELEAHNTYAGQFFTPSELCDLMTRITCEETTLRRAIEKNGFFTVAEPACGAGAQVISVAKTVKALGYNYQQQMHCTATDIDARCIHMAYVQFSLLGIPAVLHHGNALTRELFDVWHTPQHILGGWSYRLKRYQVGSIEPQKEKEAQIIAPLADQMNLFDSQM